MRRKVFPPKGEYEDVMGEMTGITEYYYVISREYRDEYTHEVSRAIDIGFYGSMALWKI